ncbi:hypothetical protein ACLOJK_037310 [Asimina triloba]
MVFKENHPSILKSQALSPPSFLFGHARFPSSNVRWDSTSSRPTCPTSDKLALL